MHAPHPDAAELEILADLPRTMIGKPDRKALTRQSEAAIASALRLA